MPSGCLIEWYEATPTPPCVDDYFDKIDRQQEAIERNCGG